MNGADWLASEFDNHRDRLGAIAYRMLGSISEADDAVQGTWLRLSRSDTQAIGNLGGWLTTAVAREALDILRKRQRRREQPLEDGRVPDPIVTAMSDTDPEEAAVLADSIGLALLVILDTLTPAERVAFVLHDVFAVPFGDIAPVLERSVEATRQLASRARRLIQRAESSPEVDPAQQRGIVDAFFAASLDGDFDTLVGVLHPDVVLRSDGGSGAQRMVRGAASVARRAAFFADPKLLLQAVLVNGSPGVVVRTPTGLPVAIMGFTFSGRKIGSIEAVADPNRFPRLNLPDFAD